MPEAFCVDVQPLDRTEHVHSGDAGLVHVQVDADSFIHNSSRAQGASRGGWCRSGSCVASLSSLSATLATRTSAHRSPPEPLRGLEGGVCKSSCGKWGWGRGWEGLSVGFRLRRERHPGGHCLSGRSGVWGPGSGAWGLGPGFGAWVPGFGAWGPGPGSGAWGPGSRIWGSGPGPGSGAWGPGSGAWGPGCGVWALG